MDDDAAEHREDELSDAMAYWARMTEQQKAAMEQIAPLVTKEELERILAPPELTIGLATRRC